MLARRRTLSKEFFHRAMEQGTDRTSELLGAAQIVVGIYDEFILPLHTNMYVGSMEDCVLISGLLGLFHLLKMPFARPAEGLCREFNNRVCKFHWCVCQAFKFKPAFVE
ncbi:hypothetical protein BGZ83_008225 [Gryganskiella cystojenkinii]|nr:hypothetical protein BGZ83_008225 [Gryganskiella cystojenkinii]